MNEDRKNNLLKIIAQSGYIKVNKLAEKIYTSTSTLRRNLSELEKEGLVKRSYGGVELSLDVTERPLDLRFQKNHEQKLIIAEKAVGLIKDNSVIFIDSSSTCLHMINFIRESMNISVFTDSLEICAALGKKNIPTYCTGGIYLSRPRAFAGEYALNTVENIVFDILFFSCSAICNEIISDINEPSSHLRRKLLKNSKERYFLCDKSKFGKKDTYVICNTKDITAIITENNIEYTSDKSTKDML